MGQMGYGYGSECHLLRWMGRHRIAFDAAIGAILGTTDRPVHWLDTAFDAKKTWPDAELKGLDFIADEDVRADWANWWPGTGNSQNWDAVGCWDKVMSDKRLVLVEAKAHIGEINSRCNAKVNGGRPTIERLLQETAKDLRATYTPAWMNRCYQYANRLAVRHFLRSKGYEPHLLMIYFVGDRQFPSNKAPQTPQGWVTALDNHKQELGLAALPADVHELFLHVHEATAWRRDGDAVVELVI